MMKKVIRSTYLPFSPPLIGEEEIQEVVKTLRSDWITTGPKTRAFEGEFARFVGAPGALALNSCTAGLHTALVTLGIGPGDEVITTPMTFAASVNVIEHVGARPVLVDVEADTLNIAPAGVTAAVTSRTRAILPVHFMGHPVDLDSLQGIASDHELHIVEDAAHALPARYRDRVIGSGSNLVAFSFYATKNMTTGEGGMLTGDPELLDRARVISLHGMSRDAWKRYESDGNWKYDVVAPGFKYNMTDIQASLGLWQLKALEGFQERRREIVALYSDAFGGEPTLEIPTVRPDVDHAWQLYVLRLTLDALRIDRDRFVEELRARNIGSSVHFIPIHLHSYYRDKYSLSPETLPVATSEYRRCLSLPLNPRMSTADAGDVADAVLDIARACAR